MLKIKIQQIDKAALTGMVKRLKEGLTNELIAARKEMAEKAYEAARSIVANEAYDTGNLYRSIEYVGDKEGIKVDLRKARYAEWVEFGHFNALARFGTVGRWVPGVKYMSRAAAEVTDKQYVAKIASKALRHYASTQSGRVKHKGTGRFV